MKVKYWAYELRFRHPFTISKGSKTHQPTLVVELSHLGKKGYGEAPAISYYDISVKKMIDDLEAKRARIEQFALAEPERYWHYLHHLLPQNSFLVCALDMAAWDWLGQVKQQSLREIWNLNTKAGPLTDYTIGMDEIQSMVSKVIEKPWPIYKIKLGSSDDLSIVQTLRQQTTSTLRVDANAAWTLEEARTRIPKLAELGVEFVEQPLAKDDWDAMEKLFEFSPLPLIADESCVQESDIERCARCFHGINIKLTKCGGLTPARRMISMARNLNLKVMCGSMNESSVGTAAIAQLLPLLDYVDADGPLLLAEDVAEGIGYDDGKLLTSGRPGLGIRFTGN